MRIALICDWFAPHQGGIESHLELLATRLGALGHELHVITSIPGPSTERPFRVHRLGIPRLPFAEVAFIPGFLSRIRAILVRERIDIAHAHLSIVSPVAIGGAAQAQRLRLPTVVTFHSLIPATRLFARAVGRLVGSGRWTARFTAVSSRVAREFQPFAGQQAIEVLPNGYDESFWTPGPVPPTTRRLIYAGRLNPKKRPWLVCAVAMELKRRGLNDTRVVVAGAGPEEARLRRQARRHGLDDLIEIVGWVDSERLRELYRASAGFLATAERESFGIAALQARATGVPVIGVAGSGVADFIEHERSGLLARSDREFVEAAVRLASDDALRRRMVENNRLQRAPFSWAECLEAHLRCYERALQARPLS